MDAEQARLDAILAAAMAYVQAVENQGKVTNLEDRQALWNTRREAFGTLLNLCNSVEIRNTAITTAEGMVQLARLIHIQAATGKARG